LRSEPGIQLALAGPFDYPPGWLERGLEKI